MGVNITAVRLLGKETEEDFTGRKREYWKREDCEWFDHLRYAGDKDFAWNSNLEWDERLDSDSDYSFSDGYVRPADLEIARKWVIEHIPEDNQPRLLNLLNRMKEDKNIYLSIS
jgi:hypothetical protein